MTKKFITQELRDITGQCQIVSDATMQNLGIERMGFCSACNHEIKNHLRIYHSTIGYLYVGACCKQILCNPDLPIIIPISGTNFTDAKGNNRIILSFDNFSKLHKIGHGRDYKEGIIDGFVINQFICNICSYMSENYKKPESGNYPKNNTIA